jgi:hypothetical protein
MHRLRLKTCLKTLAMGLIALPEPFTTIIGILILFSIVAIYRQKSLGKFGDLEVLISRSIQNPKTAALLRYFSDKQTTPGSPSRLNLPAKPGKISRKSKTILAHPEYNSWFDNHQIPVNVLHHTLKTSFPQYEAVPMQAVLPVMHHRLATNNRQR